MEFNKKNVRLYIIYLMLIMILFKGFLVDLGLPSNIKYLLDVLNVTLFFLSLDDIRANIKNFRVFILLYVIFIFVGSFSSIIHIGKWGFNIKLWLLDIRQFLRFPLFLLSCSVSMKKNHIEKIFDYLLIYQIINTILIIYQFITVKVDDFWMRGDYLNGFFGTQRGGNLYVNVLMLMVILIVYNKWINKSIKKWYAILLILTCIVDATLIELKFFYVEFAIILFLIFAKHFKSIELSRETVAKSFIVLIAIAVVFLLAVQVLYFIYPWMRGTMSFSGMVKNVTSSTGYTDSGDFNRLTAVLGVFTVCFNNRILDGIIGIGIGNCNIGGGTSTFAELFQYTNYSWFQSSYIFAETGVIGLVLYILTFLSIYIKTGNKQEYSFIVKIMVVLSLLLVIYDEVLKTEGAFLVYFMLSLGLVSIEKKDELV